MSLNFHYQIGCAGRLVLFLGRRYIKYWACAVPHCHVHDWAALMAVSKYAYVKEFEAEVKCLPETWIAIDVAPRYVQ